MDDDFDEFWDNFEPPPDWMGDIDFNSEQEDENDEDYISPQFITRIMQENGYVEVGDVLLDMSEATTFGNVYAKRFTTLEASILYLYNIGVLSFSGVTIDDNGFFIPVIPSDTDPFNPPYNG